MVSIPSPPVPTVPLPVPTAPGRSVTETLRLAERVVWAVLFALVASLLVSALAGSFVVASRPLTLPVGLALAAVVGGTVAFALADVFLE